MNFVELQQCPAVPWRNGGGLTRELLAWPVGAAAWQLRISVARIDRDGDFSVFPGVQRCFAVLLGDGVVLHLPQGKRTLTADDDAVVFDGESAPHCQLLGGPTEDLNLMATRDAGRPQLLRADEGSRLEGNLRFRALLATRACTLDVEDRSEPLAMGTLAWTDVLESPVWQLRRGAGWWITLDT